MKLIKPPKLSELKDKLRSDHLDATYDLESGTYDDISHVLFDKIKKDTKSKFGDYNGGETVEVKFYEGGWIRLTVYIYHTGEADDMVVLTVGQVYDKTPNDKEIWPIFLIDEISIKESPKEGKKNKKK